MTDGQELSITLSHRIIRSTVNDSFVESRAEQSFLVKLTVLLRTI
jgi:hypothetical protein